MFPDSSIAKPAMQHQQPANVSIKTEDTKPVDTKTKKTRNYSEWYAHVNSYKERYPTLSHAEAIKGAGLTYTKAPKKKRDTSTHKPNKWMKHVADWTEKHPDWRNKYTYKDVLQLCAKTYKKQE